MRRVVIVVFPGVQTLDVTGPAEVFRAASLIKPPGYEVTVAAADDGPLATSTVSFVPDACLDRITGPIDTLLVAGGAGALDPLGAALGVTAAVTYAVYILVSEGIARRVRPQVLAALVCTGAAVALTVGSAALGDLRPGALTAAGWGWLAALAAISTVGAIGLFFAGLARVGPTTASILATVEPLVTVLLAFLVFSETLTSIQLGGGALVLAAAVSIGRMGA